MILVFCGNCYLRIYLALKLFIPYILLKKLISQYFLYIACYKEIKYLIDCVSVIPIDDLSKIFLNISPSSMDTKLYSMV